MSLLFGSFAKQNIPNLFGLYRRCCCDRNGFLSGRQQRWFPEKRWTHIPRTPTCADPCAVLRRVVTVRRLVRRSLPIQYPSVKVSAAPESRSVRPRLAKNMVDEYRVTGFGRMDVVDDDNMVRLPRQRIVDMYKNAMSRVRVLEAKANEATICSRCNNRCDKRERTDQAFRELVLREKCLLRKLALKEQEIQDYAAQLSAMRSSLQSNSLSSLKCSLQDPAVNILIQRLRQDLSATKTRLDETQNELNAWKFTPDSNTGKRLMAKCRLLYQENEELGKVVNSGRVAKLEGELALQKNFGEEVKKSQSELDEFLQDLDEDVEVMQSTIYFLQNELQKYKANLPNTNSTKNKETSSKAVVNGIPQNDVVTNIKITSVSKTETSTQLVEKKCSKSSKHVKSKDSKQLSDCTSNQPKEKKPQPVVTDGTDQSVKNPKIHKSKHKSDGSKSEVKRIKSEKRSHNKDKVVLKKSKSDRPKSTEIKTPVTTINGLPNGS